jgi:hypothetical protein
MSRVDCDHDGGDVFGREEYQGEEWVGFKCSDCGRMCLAVKDGLEKRTVVNTESSSEIIAYLMPDSNTPHVL